MLQEGEGLTVEEGYLAAKTLRDTTLLRRGIAVLERRRAATRVALRALRICRPASASGPLDIVISPAPPPDCSSFEKRGAAALVYMIEPGAGELRTNSATVTRYDLTPAELKVAGAILRGHSGLSAADSLGVSYNTVKTHLKRIYAKTGTNSQAALIRLFLEPQER